MSPASGWFSLPAPASPVRKSLRWRTDEVRLEAGSGLSSGDVTASLEFAEEAPLRFENADAGAAVLGVSASRALFVEREGSSATGGSVDRGCGLHHRVARRAADRWSGSRSATGPSTAAARAGHWVRATSLSAALPARKLPECASARGFSATWRARAGYVSPPTIELNIRRIAGAGFVARNRYSTRRRSARAARCRSSPRRGSFHAAQQFAAVHAGARGPLPGSSLSLSAHDLVLGPGEVDVDAFDLLAIAAEQELVGEGTSRLSTAGDLTLTAANIGATSDADRVLHGRWLVAHCDSAQALADTKRLTSQLGGRVSLEATRIEHGGAVRVGSGRVELNAGEQPHCSTPVVCWTFPVRW